MEVPTTVAIGTRENAVVVLGDFENRDPPPNPTTAGVGAARQGTELAERSSVPGRH